jgi:hypothetical protein
MMRHSVSFAAATVNHKRQILSRRVQAAVCLGACCCTALPWSAAAAAQQGFSTAALLAAQPQYERHLTALAVYSVQQLAASACISWQRRK